MVPPSPRQSSLNPYLLPVIYFHSLSCPKRTLLCRSLEFPFHPLFEKRLGRTRGSFNIRELQFSGNWHSIKKKKPLLKAVKCRRVCLGEMKVRVEGKRKKDLWWFGVGIFGLVSTVVSDLCGIGAFSSLNFNVRGAKGNRQFTLPHLCNFACVHPIWRLYFHISMTTEDYRNSLSHNSGLTSAGQTFHSCFYNWWWTAAGSVLRARFCYGKLKSKGNFIRQKSQPITLRELRIALLGSRKAG